jgi:LCP family protein required for cell wall assembly
MSDPLGPGGRPEGPVADPRRRQRRRRSRYGVHPPRVRTVVVVVLGFLLSGFGGALSFFWPSITTAFGITGHTLPSTAASAKASGHGSAASDAPTDTPAPPTGAPFTVLLMGSDNDSKFTSGQVPVFCCAQSLILMRVDPATSSITMLSFPRDLWVPLYGSSGRASGYGKIDQAFGTIGGRGTNGAAAEVNTIENDFQVHVDHYVWIGLQGLINLINDVGGINLVATHPVMDDEYPYDVGGSTNPNAADRVSVLPGAQHMNGYQALEYVRSRHDDLGEDIGRTIRQQQVLVALRQKLAILSVGDVNEITSALSGEVLTDVPLTQISTLLGIAKDVDAGHIQHAFLTQYQTGYEGNQQALIPDMPAILAYVHKYFPAS